MRFSVGTEIGYWQLDIYCTDSRPGPDLLATNEPAGSKRGSGLGHAMSPLRQLRKPFPGLRPVTIRSFFAAHTWGNGAAVLLNRTTGTDDRVLDQI
jgi:hypothetical protein